MDAVHTTRDEVSADVVMLILPEGVLNSVESS